MRYIHSSTTANDADKLVAAFYLCCLRITTLVVLILAYCPCRCSHWHRQWLFAYRCRLLYARTTFRQGGPYFAGKNWTGGPLFTPDQLSRDRTYSSGNLAASKYCPCKSTTISSTLQDPDSEYSNHSSTDQLTSPQLPRYNSINS